MHSSHTYAIEVEAEAADKLGENVSTFATLRLPCKGPLDLTLSQDKINPEIAVQYLNAGPVKHVLGPMGGTLKTTHYLTGHGSSTSAAVTKSAFETYLGNIIGNSTLSAASGTTATGGTASAPTTAAASGFPAGGLCRIGVAGDGRGNGMGAAVISHAASTLTLYNDIDVAPNNGDVVYSGTNIYPSESPTSTSVTTYRMRVLTANDKYQLHGCVPTSYAITGTNTGEMEMIEVTWTIARWKRTTTGTFPSTLATDTNLPAPVAGGSFVWQNVGTKTRNKLVIRNFKLESTIGMEVQNGPGGYDPYQTIVSARRTLGTFKVSFAVDAEANTASPAVDADFLSDTPKYALYTLNNVDGKSVCFFFPNLVLCGPRPVQKIDGNVNRYFVEAYAYTYEAGTTDLERSAYRIFFS